MDLGSESVEENEVNHDDGSFGNENFGFGFHGNLDAVTPKSDHKGTVDAVGSEEGGNSKGTSGKGVGLKKWKRIRRDVVKDPNSSADSGKILKRGLSGNANLSENQPFLRDVKEKGEEGSSNIFGNVEFSDGYAIRGSSTDSRYAVGSGFAVGADSENSEDRSSKSSTAASQPKLRSEKSRSKNVSSKNLGNSAQRVSQCKGPIESSKKPGGGGRVTMEKENSLSSMESDSRSSNFKPSIFAATSNGNHRGRSNVYDGDNGGEAHSNENFTEGEKVGEDEDLVAENLATNLPWGAAEERSVNNQSSPVEDTLIESISSLQAVQEALEEEVLKFREIGVEVVSPDDDSAAGIAAVDVGLHNSCLSGQYGAEEAKQTASSSMEIQVSSVKQNISILETKLEELQGMLALKDSRIAELEKYKEVEYELEGLFRQKIEAEVEYLAITKVIKNLKVGADFQLKLLEKQEKLSENQAEVLNKVIETENKASVLKKKAEELEKYSDDTEIVKKSLELQKGVCKVTFYLFLQVMLLIFFVWLFMSQLSLNSGVVVPT
ncbi:unnamed protein product [Lupinus luteus]|uniref:WPP domain-interacting protein 1 n=1 Tax=Lupinus luteus TaxID=3873 RepID=A0AAV1WNR3_LUPLU